MNYFLQGFTLISTKGLKRFVFIPLAINLILFSVAFYFLFGQIESSITWMVDLIPDWDWLSWLKTGLAYIIWPIAVLSILLIFGLIFGTLANWIAAPFNGLLAEKVELHLTGQSLGDSGLMDIVRDIPRTFGRELAKLSYYLPRAVGFLILFFILPLVGQVLWFLFSAWMMAIQYCDYPFDNHKVPFGRMKDVLKNNKSQSFSFGITVSIFSLIPIVNFLVMPVAVCGATALWVKELKEQV
ncbi:sulfate transporter CysZ [Paraglaciecola aquimarina]|uniref:Sulfate transporter CysZ n=1 Tax=Paraglaciecola aquimarina TaxID=1235557 RepID=A0ABU3SYY9_9ALTE|nr:sulfate transporter CysZ [Paraglaciecola aquimarina]MDU0355230.1 sulfate transporter CysZ [Paraglaciecola aquimarina]